MCRLLLRYGANPNSRDTERWTPLHAAATCHHTEMCKLLIDHGADLLAMNVDGYMPYECCMPGQTLNLIEMEMDKRGITQEEIDDWHRVPECEMLADMEALYKAGADLDMLDPQGASMTFGPIPSKIMNAHYKKDSNREGTPLHFSLVFGMDCDEICYEAILTTCNFYIIKIELRFAHDKACKILGIHSQETVDLDFILVGIQKFSV
ncbi:unnamed protein product [Trichobilharzia regenti]|nr:unnamed protein product [Trichobilharzia regenti]